MRNHPIWMRQVPGGEGVRAEPLMNERKRGHQIGIHQVKVIPTDLVGHEEPLVYHRPAAQAGNVEKGCLLKLPCRRGTLDYFTNHIELALEIIGNLPPTP